MPAEDDEFEIVSKTYFSGTGFTVALGAVGRAVPEAWRAQALAVVSLGGAAGQFLALPYTHALIDGFRWLPAMLVLAATAALMVPLALAAGA